MVSGTLTKDVSPFFKDKTVTLSATQATGADPVIDRNDYRTALKIVPPKDCTLGYTQSVARGEPLFGSIANTFVGGECPANALYVFGLAAGDTLVILEG